MHGKCAVDYMSDLAKVTTQMKNRYMLELSPQTQMWLIFCYQSIMKKDNPVYQVKEIDTKLENADAIERLNF